jgi:apolipoprotein N-acyltransferase
VTFRRPWVATLLWTVFAAAAGALWAAQFERESLRIAPWVALVPTLLLLGAPRPGWLAFVQGWTFWMVAIPWIVPTLVTFGGLAPALAWALMVGLAAYLSLYTVAFALPASRLWRAGLAGRWGLALVGVPAVFVAGEWLRGWFLTGFPWNLAAYAWVDVPGALPLASWLGPWGVSFLVVFTNAGVGLGVARRRWEPAVLTVLLPLAVLPFAGRFAGGDVSGVRFGQPVRVIQPNIRNLVAYDPLPVRRNYQRLLAMSQEACDEQGALLVWPESAAWPYRFPVDPLVTNDVRNLVAAGCPLLLNSTVEEGAEIRNAAFLVTPDGGQSRYDKRHLVPFGEYVPLRGVFGFLDSLAREAGSFTPAEELKLLDWGRERLGVAICFEITFPGEVAEAVRAGATSLVTITNDAWYGDTSAPWQHFRAVRFRAAENDRPLLRAAITGVSALVEADGGVASQLGVYEQGVLRGRLQGRTGLTPYARLPWLVPAVCVLLGAAALVTAIRATRAPGADRPR